MNAYLPDRAVANPPLLASGPAARSDDVPASLIALFDKSIDAVCITDEDWENGPTIIYVNPQFERITGWPAEQAIGQTPRILQGPLTDRSVFATLIETIERGESWSGEAVNYHRDGKRFLMEWSITPYALADGAKLLVAVQRDVSQRWHDGLRLAEQARRLELAQRTARLGHWSLCPKTRRLRFSRTALELWGYGPEVEAGVIPDERLTLAWWKQTVHRDDRGALAAISPRMTDPARLTYRITRADGAEIWIRTVAEFETDESGAIISIHGIHQDVTEEMAARHGERMALSQLKEALESSPDAILLLDPEEKVVAFNGAFLALYPKTAPLIEVGRPIGEILSHKIDQGEYVIAGSRESWLQDRLHRLRHPPEAGWEQRMQDGRVQLVTERRTASGGFVSIRRDITETKRAKELLERRQRAIEASADGIALADPDGRLSYVNRACSGLFGVPPGDMLRRHWGSFYDSDSYRPLAEDIDRTLRRYGRWQGELVAVNAGAAGGLGSRVEHEVSLTRLDDGSLIAVMRDIGERRVAQEERDALMQQFNAAQKMESLGLMAGGIAHDFNNILSSILGYGAFLVEDLADQPELRGYAEKIVASGESAQRVIQQILAFSRRRAADKVPCDFRLALRETRDMLEVSLPSTVELSTEIPDQPVTVTASLAELGQIAMNLCVNARDALEGEPGSIDLALRIGLAGDYVETDDTSSAELANAFTISEIGCGRSRLTAGALAAEQPVAVLTVEDSGKGMDRETLQRVFEPFFSTKGHGRGTGLGLAAVFGIVTGNGGALVVETAPGRGCRFDIIWPLSDVPARSEADQAPDAERGSGRIMIVDDEPMVLDSTAQALVRLGYEVDTLNSPVEAAEILLASWECYDLLLFDQTMPEMTGLMVIDTLHQAGADLPIFLYSGHDPELEDLDPAAHGVQGVFGKPLDMKRFSQAIKQVLS